MVPRQDGDTMPSVVGAQRIKADLQFARARRAAAAFLGRRPGKFS